MQRWEGTSVIRCIVALSRDIELMKGFEMLLRISLWNYTKRLHEWNFRISHTTQTRLAWILVNITRQLTFAWRFHLYNVISQDEIELCAGIMQALYLSCTFLFLCNILSTYRFAETHIWTKFLVASNDIYQARMSRVKLLSRAKLLSRVKSATSFMWLENLPDRRPEIGILESEISEILSL